MTDQTAEYVRDAQAEHDHCVRVVQSKVETFVKACGGSVPVRALRMYIETQERSDAVISRALVAPDSPVQMVRSSDGTPVVVLSAQPVYPPAPAVGSPGIDQGQPEAVDLPAEPRTSPGQDAS